MKKISIVLLLGIVLTVSCKKDTVVILIPETTSICNKGLEAGIVIDIDGNPYQTIQIGNRLYTFQNLKTTKYNDGTPIPNIVDNALWEQDTSGAWSYFKNKEDEYPLGYASIDKLYNWYAVNSGKLCPEGWEVLTDHQWTEYFVTIQNDPIKYIPCNLNINYQAVGHRNSDGSWGDEYEFSWSSTSFDNQTAWTQRMPIGTSLNYREKTNKNFGLKCRCTKEL